MATYASRRSVASAAALIPWLLFSACGDSAEAREARDSLRKAIDATKNLAVAKWEDLKRESEPMLNDARQKVAELRQDIERGGAKVSEQARRAADQAARKLEEAAKAVESAKDAGSESAEKAWQSFREAIGHAEQALKEAWSELGK